MDTETIHIKDNPPVIIPACCASMGLTKGNERHVRLTHICHRGGGGIGPVAGPRCIMYLVPVSIFSFGEQVDIVLMLC